LLPRHVARADLIEDSWVDRCEEAELADLTDGNRKRGGDRLFCPVFRGKGLDRAPEVHRGHRSPDHVFAHRAHVVEVVGVFDQDVDLGETEFDGEPHAPGAVDDGESAVFFGHGWRLDDADDLDAGLYGCVRHFAGLDFARVAGVLFQCAGIDASQFHLNSPELWSSRTSSKMKSGSARATGRGKGGA
jgi:hypothetical protein